ncbi:DNA alkylation repair protein [Clostridium thermarum]|uniref:DNA alkylation repair protein n=1 Tax=Clostridium thermarum TaxID=1716543 RepID=UPI0013D556B6|nr:DNA alkylation repair protein [Clostridium thermarum]
MNMEELKMVEWNSQTYKTFIELLKSQADEEYGKFNQKVIPNLGFSYYVRMPILRKMAKHLEKNKHLEDFYNYVSSGQSYEEKLLQSILFSKIGFKSPSDMFNSIDYYMLKINNWALCDSFATNIKPLVEKNKEIFFQMLPRYLETENPWAVRFALVVLNNYFTEEQYLESIFENIKSINNCQDYYVNMAIAWLVSSCYLVDKNKTKDFISKGYLNDWCINKSIQKIVESLSVTAVEKEEIKKLRRKKN